MSSLKDDSVKLEVIDLKFNKGMSDREIEAVTGVPKTSVNDFANKRTYTDWWLDYDESVDLGIKIIPDTTPSKSFDLKAKTQPVRIETSKRVKTNSKHIMIPDLQIKPGIDMSYLSWIGQYLADKKPDVIINIGDHFDLPSLSSYDKGTKKAEGKHLADDIEAGIIGMNMLLQPIADLQAKELEEFGEVKYKPKMVFTTGNHEQRLERHLNANPELTDLVSYADFKLEDNGWEVYDFLEPAIVNGVMYIHYLPNPMTGRPYGGTAQNILSKAGCSVSFGHVQKLDIATRHLPNGQQQWLMVCGAGYPHNEGYKGYTGNHHFRGIVVKHGVNNGNYNPMPVSLDYLKEKYG